MPFSDLSSPPTFAEIIALVNVRLVEAQEVHSQASRRLSQARILSQEERRTAEDAEKEALFVLILLSDTRFRAELTILNGHWQRFYRRYTQEMPDGSGDADLISSEDTKELRAVWDAIRRTIAAKVETFNQRSL